MPNIIIGLLSISGGLWGVSVWWYSLAELLRGFTPLLLLVFGVIALMAGVTGVRNDGDSELDDSELVEKLNDKKDSADGE